MIFTPSEQERQAQAFDPDKLAAIVASIQTKALQWSATWCRPLPASCLCNRYWKMQIRWWRILRS